MNNRAVSRWSKRVWLISQNQILNYGYVPSIAKPEAYLFLFFIRFDSFGYHFSCTLLEDIGFVTPVCYRILKLQSTNFPSLLDRMEETQANN